MKKKALSLALALALCVGLSVPAFASGLSGSSTGGSDAESVQNWESINLTLEDVTFSVDPIGVVTIHFMKEDGSEGSAVTAYMFDQPASVSMKDGRIFTDWVQEEWYINGGRFLEYFLEISEIPGIDNDTFNLNVFNFSEEHKTYLSPYMVSKSYVDSLIEEGHKVDIQPYTAAQPEQPTEPTTPTQPEQPVQPDAPGSYTVKKGDTWSSICTNFYGDNAQRYNLMKANKNVKLKAGTVITLPEKLGKYVLIPAPAAADGEKLYTVKAGDTLGKIAAAEYGKVSEYKAIFERNSDRLKNANLIYVGQVIVLPAKK